jgi:hypothetical protein
MMYACTRGTFQVSSSALKGKKTRKAEEWECSLHIDIDSDRGVVMVMVMVVCSIGLCRGGDVRGEERGEEMKMRREKEKKEDIVLYILYILFIYYLYKYIVYT